MNLEKLNPWNWFKHENDQHSNHQQIPVARAEAKTAYPSSDSHSLLRLHQEMDRLFDNVFNALRNPSSRSLSSGQELLADRSDYEFLPDIDIAGDENKYEITLEVPGLTQADITVEVKGDVLKIEGLKEDKQERKDKHYYRVERRLGKFQRTLSLPSDACADDINADLKNGVLTLSIPRYEVEKKEIRRIAISS